MADEDGLHVETDVVALVAASAEPADRKLAHVRLSYDLAGACSSLRVYSDLQLFSVLCEPEPIKVSRKKLLSYRILRSGIKRVMIKPYASGCRVIDESIHRLVY